MVLLWLSGMIIGLLAGRLAILPAREWLLLPAVTPLTLIGALLCGMWAAGLKPGRGRLRRHSPWARRCTLWLLGAGYGAGHAAPPSPGPRGAVEVVRTVTPDPSAFGPLVVCDRSPASLSRPRDCFEAFGPQAPGSYGQLRASPGAPGLFTDRSYRFHLEGDFGSEGSTRLGSTIRWLRKGLSGRLRLLDRRSRSTLLGLLFGQKLGVRPALLRALRSLGMVHLLAASGLHATVLVGATMAWLAAPLRLAYAFRLIGPGLWFRLQPVLAVLRIVLAGVYLAITGMPTAAQRACLSLILSDLLRCVTGIPSLGRRLLWTLVAQATLFPLGFLGEGTLLSWFAYLLLVAPGSRRWGPWWTRLAQAGLRQVLLMALNLAAFGVLAPCSLLANLFLFPAYAMTLAPAVLILAAPRSWPARALFHHLAQLEHLTIKIGMLMPIWQATQPSPLMALARGLSGLTVLVVVLNICRRLSIEDAGEPRSAGPRALWGGLA